MDKRYQIFVSSTYADLRDERQKVIQALMEMDCIPAGMELFPAADEEQWEFIKRVIDDCDFYLLIIGGRYGSLTPEGISYTEQEYDYAISIGLKVLAFIHERPDDISVGDSDIDPSLRAKLDAFRKKVSTKRLVKFWRDATELPGLVALSVAKTIKLYPAIGWVRADRVGSDELLVDVNELRKENEALRKQVEELRPTPVVQDLNLASMGEEYELHLEWHVAGYSRDMRDAFRATWAEIFGAIAAEMMDHPYDDLVNRRMGAALYRLKKPAIKAPGGLRIDHDSFQTIRLQLIIFGLIKVVYKTTTKGGRSMFWSLTDSGQRLLIQLRGVKTAAKETVPG